MANITAQMVKELRESTGAGMMDCKKALVECDGDAKKAAEYLQVKGLAKAAKRGGRKTAEGYVGVYRHHDGKTAILVEVNCETDFVARTENFRHFCDELALHICGLNPLGVRREDIDASIVEDQRRIATEKAIEAGKPEAMIPRIVDGAMNKWFSEITLLDQIWMGEGKETVEQKRAELSAQTGENIRINRFARIAVGENVAADTEEAAAE
jgi:elongation factor Ts